MSTAATTTATSTFGFASIGHFFSSAFGDLKKATRFVEQTALPKVQLVVEGAEKVTALVAPFVPQAATALTIERAIDSAAGELLAAVHTTDAVEGATFVDIKLDIASYTAFKQFIADQKDALAKLGYTL